MKRVRMNAPNPAPTANTVDKLLTLASVTIPGLVGDYARKYAQTGDPDSLDMALLFHDLGIDTNVVGRIPTRSFHNQDLLLFEQIHGKTLANDRRMGKVRGIAMVEGPSGTGGVIVRVDSVTYPEMWLDITLSPEQIRDAQDVIASNK